ncbi:MAG TPA: 4-(cytidine 5'-diphospho)-2-C-methyl-D-erythritol kinase [Acidimicrobiales bacterium]|nr:4-(cytidine 5'-diphospho)-2-C-methyl-D-erythritol kinase [Acidimicrobiales bacterium]
MTVLLEAPAKLTRTLAVVGLRADGYHLLESEMVSVDLCDTVEIDPAGRLAVEVVDEVEGSRGLPVPADGDNLVARALRLVGREASVRLTKRIPAGAGLGGGSSDAAAVLRWAGVRPDQAGCRLAASLGADVPFCLQGGRARVSGVGERVEPLPYADVYFTLLLPPFGMSTPAVYRRWDELGGPSSGAGNDLLPAALAAEPSLASWGEALSAATGRPARLAGSGSTWFVEGRFPFLEGSFPDPAGGPAGWVVVARAARAADDD